MNQQAERVVLAAARRSLLGKKVKQLRGDGWVPAVVYGHGFEPVPLKMKAHELKDALSDVGGSQLIGLRIEDQDDPELVLVRDVQRDCILGDLLHVDFYRVVMTERITAEVPLVLTGESPIDKNNEGVVLQGIATLEVECLPADLVDAIEVDLADLTEVGQRVHVNDLAIPAGIEVISDPEEMVVQVVYVPEVEEEVPEELEVEAEEVEVSAGEVVEEEAAAEESWSR